MSLAPPPPPLRLTSRPILVAALALGGGIALANALPQARLGALITGVLILAAAVGAYALWARGRMVTLHALATAALVLGGTAGLGAARLAAFTEARPDGLGPAADEASVRASLVRGRDRDETPPITLWARVATVPEASPFAVRFAVETDSARLGDTSGAISDRVQVSLALPQPSAWSDEIPEVRIYPALHLGDRVRLTGALAAPPRRRNPADFDYGAYLRRQGTAATLRVDSEADVVFLAPPARPLDRIANVIGARVRRAVARHIPGVEAQSVALALLVADWSGLEDSTVEAFRETGLLHLLSVSGLHLVLVGLALYALLGPILRRLRVPRRSAEWGRAGATLATMGVYVIAAGSGAPVVRAFVMAAVLVVGRASERRVDTLNGLGLAALLLLLWRPTFLFEVGFQLSFAAVAALVSITPHVMAALPTMVSASAWRKATTTSVVASAIATVGTAPILLAHFGRVPLAGIVLNLPAVPLTSGALGGSLGAAVSADTPPADLFGALASACVRCLLWVTDEGASVLGDLAVERYVTGGLALAALAGFVLALALWPRRGARVRLVLASMVCLVLSAWTSTSDARPALDAVFLDVGQGDATLIRFPNGHAILIDAGERMGSRDEGLRTVVPHLERYGIRRLDAVVATHPHADHIGGIDAVLRAVPVGRLVHNGQTEGSEMWTNTLRLADSLDVRSQSVSAGDTLSIDPTVRVRVLGPSEALAAGDANEASVVLLIEYGETRLLLAGDAETAAEAEIVARYARILRADVIKVGHHGSRTSSSVPFVAAASGIAPGESLASARTETPRWAIVSVAQRNRHGLPDEEPVMRWRAAGATVVQTADEGAVWMRSGGRSVKRIDWRTE